MPASHRPASACCTCWFVTIKDFALYLAAGRLLTWLLQTNGLTRPVWDRHAKLKELADCDLCLGFWVYLALAPRRVFGLWGDVAERVVLVGGGAPAVVVD